MSAAENLTEGWEVPQHDDRHANRHVHYMRYGISLCLRLGNSRRPLQEARPDAKLLCRPCDRELERAGT